MIIDPAPQNSLEWLARRASVVTASEMHNILTPEFAFRRGEMRHSYLCRKLAEKWLGSTLPGFSTIDTEFGSILEDEALPLFSLEHNVELTRVGLCLTDDGKVGCSPDALIGEDGGLEAKCKRAENHIKHLLDGGVPKDHLVQVHSALFVTGRPWWKFISYSRRLPLLVVHVERDERIQAKIHEALTSFLDDLDAGMKRLEEINGGPPRRRAVPTPAPPVMEFIAPDYLA